jgi:hypothetical protein
MVGRRGGRNRATTTSEEDLTERLLAVLREAPGAKTSDLSERLGGSNQLAVRAALTTLEGQGSVHRTGATRGTRWYLGPAAAGALPPEAGEDVPTDATGDRRGPKERVLDEHRELLGTVPDSEAAAITGASLRTIAAYRKKHHTTVYPGPRRRGASPAGADGSAAPPVASSSAAASADCAAWKVDIRVDGDVVTRFVIASTLVEAADAASQGARTLGGDVVGIGWAGETL